MDAPILWRSHHLMSVRTPEYMCAHAHACRCVLCTDRRRQTDGCFLDMTDPMIPSNNTCSFWTACTLPILQRQHSVRLPFISLVCAPAPLCSAPLDNSIDNQPMQGSPVQVLGACRMATLELSQNFAHALTGFGAHCSSHCGFKRKVQGPVDHMYHRLRRVLHRPLGGPVDKVESTVLRTWSRGHRDLRSNGTATRYQVGSLGWGFSTRNQQASLRRQGLKHETSQRVSKSPEPISYSALASQRFM